MSLMHSDAVIANAASLSGEIDVTDRVVVSIVMPATWTAAQLTLLGSQTSGGTFTPLYDAEATELVIEADVSRTIVIAPDATRGVKYLKVRSGTAGTPVNQGGSRTLAIGTVEDTAA